MRPGVKPHSTAIRAAVSDIQMRFEQRSTIVETGRPNMPTVSTSPLTVLEQESTKPLKPAALSLEQGHALSIGGENYIVDAVIDIGGNQPMRMYRIDVAPERWLLANERFAALLSPGQFTEQGESHRG